MTRSTAIVTIVFVAACGGSSSSSNAPATHAPAQNSNPPATSPVNPPPSAPPQASQPPAPSEPPAAPDPSTPPDLPAAPVPSTPATPSSPATRAHHGHSHCGWIGADTADAGIVTFMANADWFDAIHPKWFTLNSDGTVRTLALVDDAKITATAHQHGVLLMPLIDAGSGDYIRAAAANPAAHAQALADLVAQHGYDGIELDYEHLWSAADRPGYVALITAVAAKLHAAGKQLSLALPTLSSDTGDSAYDYVALQQQADVLHLMGYDFHYLGGPHLGPLAPLGWVGAAMTYVESLGAPQKYVLGVANYAVGNGWYTSGGDAATQCGPGYSRATDHMASCSLGHQDAGSAPHCTTANGDVWFEDAVSVGEKATVASAHHLGGMSYWTVGSETPGFLEAIGQAFP